jgi:hypothetical protein
MMLKRNTAYFNLGSLSAFSIPTLAFASEPMSFLSIKDEPLFVAVSFVAAVLLVMTITLAVTSIQRHHASCKNTDCSYHPLYLRMGNHYDYSGMDTPEELLENVAPQTAEEPLESVVPQVIAESVKNLAPQPIEEPVADVAPQPIEDTVADVAPQPIEQQLEFKRTMLFRPNSSMSFTDDMIMEVRNALHQQSRREELQNAS